jgi:hypothetical protein
MRFSVVMTFPNSREAGDTEWATADNIGSAQIVNVWCNPASIVRLKQIVAGLMVATDEDSQVGSNPFSTVILMEITNFFIPVRH